MVQSWSPESYFTMPYRWIGAKFPDLSMSERQGFYMPVKEVVGLRISSASPITFQQTKNVALERKISTKPFIKFLLFGCVPPRLGKINYVL